MKKLYESEYVSGLEKRISELETEVRAWRLHGVYLTLEEERSMLEEEDRRKHG